MKHEVNTVYPKDSGGDKSLLAFHSYMGTKRGKKKRKQKIAGVRPASRVEKKKPGRNI